MFVALANATNDRILTLFEGNKEVKPFSNKAKRWCEDAEHFEHNQVANPSEILWEFVISVLCKLSLLFFSCGFFSCGLFFFAI